MKRSRLIDRVLPFIVFVVLEILSVAMIAGGGTVQRYRIMRVCRSLNIAMWRVSGTVCGYFNLGTENRRLAEENLELKRALARYLAIDTTGTICDSLPSKNGFSYTLAKVIKNSTNRRSNWLILDAGEDRGVKPGSGVVTDRGVVGIVEAVDSRYCRVVSFLNATQTVSAKLAGSGTFGLLSWSGTDIGKALLSEVPTHTAVAEGDTVSTSGFSSIFPADIPIGTASGTSSDGIYVTVSVNLFQDFSSLQYVYIVKNDDAEEINRIDNDR